MFWVFKMIGMAKAQVYNITDELNQSHGMDRGGRRTCYRSETVTTVRHTRRQSA